MQTVMRVSKVEESQGRIGFTPVKVEEGGARAGEAWFMGIPAEQLSGLKVGDVVTVSVAKKAAK